MSNIVEFTGINNNEIYIRGDAVQGLVEEKPFFTELESARPKTLIILDTHSQLVDEEIKDVKNKLGW